MFVCWSVKGGCGTTVVSALARRAVVASRPTLLVDLGGDAPAALGVTRAVRPWRLRRVGLAHCRRICRAAAPRRSMPRPACGSCRTVRRVALRPPSRSTVERTGRARAALARREGGRRCRGRASPRGSRWPTRCSRCSSCGPVTWRCDVSFARRSAHRRCLVGEPGRSLGPRHGQTVDAPVAPRSPTTRMCWQGRRRIARRSRAAQPHAAAQRSGALVA